MKLVKIKIVELIWDDFNISHIARHGVSQVEVVEILTGKILVNQSYLGRLLITGRTNSGRVLSVVLHKKTEKHHYYVVTARPASRKERRVYANEHIKKETTKV